VIDGDTIEVLKGGKAVKIRLNGIDCPEKNQAFGSRAKQYTSSLIFGKKVRVKEKELDRYGRTIADIYLGDVWVNQVIVENGYAWHYKRYSNDKSLDAAERNARKARLGLWSDLSPVPPWEFRSVN
jgi:micrococcal nuclease